MTSTTTTDRIDAEFADDPLAPLAQEAIELARGWVATTKANTTSAERRSAERLTDLIADEEGLTFATRFLDRVARAEEDTVAARQLAALVPAGATPGFLGPIDRLMLRAGALVAPILPTPVIAAARARLEQLVGHLVVDSDPDRMVKQLAKASEPGLTRNLNMLGEAVLGEEEAARRRDQTVALLGRPGVDYVSIKVSSVVSQIEVWDHHGSTQRVLEHLRPIADAALSHDPVAFLNLDVEEYDDLDLTVEVFLAMLADARYDRLPLGLALQAYLPDSVDIMDRLLDAADQRDARGGTYARIRLVKGANLSMEQVDAELHRWPQAPFGSKRDSDANFKRLLDRSMHPDRLRGARIGLASHNLFDVAFGVLLARARGVEDRLDLEMLHGMAPGAARAVRDEAGSVRLYTPVVAWDEFDAAVAYLVRRLEEAAMPGNFLRAIDALEDPAVFQREADRFLESLAVRHEVEQGSRRRRPELAPDHGATGFVNTPDLDPALPEVRARLEAGASESPVPVEPQTPMVEDIAGVDAAVAGARAGADRLAAMPADQRAALLERIADEVEARRDAMHAVMMREAGKTVAESDPEISEAIDFCRYYAASARELDVPGATSEPLGVVCVVPPWNFPVAIPLGGVVAALAAGSSAILKPAPETPRCAELLAEACHAAGADDGLVTFLRVPDTEVGQHLITHEDVDAVILTGALATAQLFRSWRPDLHLLAETSGKNALVITPSADLDLAVDDLVRSAFGHAGQKCSAASLAILVGEVATSERFRRQLVDAVTSIRVGYGTDLGTRMGPLIRPPEGPLHDALTQLAPGESWLVEPRCLDEATNLWSPGVKEGVAPGSPFHLTECFGPVLGLMTAPDLDTALTLQHAPGFGLTGGIHSLDDAEVEHWLERVEVGNVYVNRHTTGAIVQRQSFGGWKRSAIGGGAKAGGPNYVAALRRWRDAPGDPSPADAAPGDPSPADAAPGATAPVDPSPVGAAAGGVEPGPVGPGPDLDGMLALAQRLSAGLGPAGQRDLATVVRSDAAWWRQRFAQEEDRSGMAAERNAFRYRPFARVAVRLASGADPVEVARAVLAARSTGAVVLVSAADASSLPPAETIDARVTEDDAAFASRLGPRGTEAVRIVGGRAATSLRSWCEEHGVRIVDEPVVRSGRIELPRLLREQAISRTMHRYGRIQT
ncbi:MAG: proline dehydrogenase family protein [Nitriliruptoraceae bacterium]|nr:proline dehydrogenase family protein [Nitriliruptoraceae bacterium]